MFVAVKIRDCHRNRLRAGHAVLKALTEAWTGTSLTERCERIVIFPDENPGTSGVRSPDEHSNESRTTLRRSGSSGAVRVLSEGTRFLTMARPVHVRVGRHSRPYARIMYKTIDAFSPSSLRSDGEEGMGWGRPSTLECLECVASILPLARRAAPT